MIQQICIADQILHFDLCGFVAIFCLAFFDSEPDDLVRGLFRYMPRLGRGQILKRVIYNVIGRQGK